MASHLKQSIATELEGTLLISRNLFAYFLLVALEAGGPLRAVALLAASPLLSAIRLAHSREASLALMTFISTAGLKPDDVKAVAKATLPRFFLSDLGESAFRAFACGGKKYVVTCLPRAFVEPFLKEYLDVDCVVIGTELEMAVTRRHYSGLASLPGGVMSGAAKLEALFAARVEDDRQIDVGLASSESEDQQFLLLCKEQRLIPPQEKATPLQRKEYPRPVVFHDGRLVRRPDPLGFLVVLLWLPLGVLLAATRIIFAVVIPFRLGPMGSATTGFRVRADLPAAAAERHHRKGRLFACNHHTLLDPVMLSTVLQRKVSAVTYSLSGFSEAISPIPTVRLRRDREKDRAIMQSRLARGDLVVCPEGTTSREPYLLRFSPLFTEVADMITPVAVRAAADMFYGTSARGHKWLDSWFFLMNPFPRYQLQFLEPVSGACAGGTAAVTSIYGVANGIQRSIGEVLGFECTNFTRKDKYQMIAGNDGIDERALA